jgi:hypothetical protein
MKYKTEFEPRAVKDLRPPLMPPNHGASKTVVLEAK